MATDPIAAAVAATEPEPVQAVQVSVTLSTGRPIVMIVPADMTGREALDFVNFVSGGLGAELERRRGAPVARRPSLVIPKIDLARSRHA